MKDSLRFFILISFMAPVLIFAQQLENPGFEDWEDAGTVKDEPVDWSTIKTSDDPGISSLAPVTFDRSDDSHTGNYSLKLYNVTVFGFVATGAITNGRFHAEFNLEDSYSYTQEDDAKWHTPFTYRPDSLVGWFKFYPTEIDKAQFKVILHVDEGKLPENGTMPNWIGIAVYFTEPGVTYDEWTRFAVPFNYFREDLPEFELTVLNSGDSTSAYDGSYLLVDDLELVYSSSGISELSPADPYLYVSAGRLNINLEQESAYLHQWFHLIDVTGQTVLTRQLESNQVVLPGNLPEGFYVAVLQGKSKQYVQKIMIR